MKIALLIVDVQKFFLHDAPDELVGNIVEYIQSGTADVIAFTVFKNTPDSNFVKSLRWSKCADETDVELPKEFLPYIFDDNVFTRAAYSGFSTTNLNEYLKAQRVDKVIICGVDTDACVLATAFSAFDHGYLVDVNTELTYSGGNLEPEAQAIIKRSLLAR